MLRINGIVRFVLTTSPVGDRVVVDTWKRLGYASPTLANHYPHDLDDDMSWADAIGMCRDRTLSYDSRDRWLTHLTKAS